MTEKLPTSSFDQQLERLTGLPNGAHTQPVVVQVVDFYGNVTAWMVQTVKTDEGETVFLTSVASETTQRIVVPARVLQTIDRQRDTVRTKVRRRHGQRLAEERGPVTFTPEQRQRAQVARVRNAALRAAAKVAKELGGTSTPAKRAQ